MAELWASILGMQFAKKIGYKKVEVVTDSKFLKAIKKKLREEWKSNDHDWQKKAVPQNISFDIVEAFDKLRSEIDITWINKPENTCDMLSLAYKLADKGCSTASIYMREQDAEALLERNKRKKIKKNANRLPPTLLRSVHTVLMNKTNATYKILCRLNIPPARTKKIVEEKKNISVMTSGHAYGGIITLRTISLLNSDLAPNIIVKCHSGAHNEDTLIMQEGCVVGIAWQHPFDYPDDQFNLQEMRWFPINMDEVWGRNDTSEEPELLFDDQEMINSERKVKTASKEENLSLAEETFKFSIGGVSKRANEYNYRIGGFGIVFEGSYQNFYGPLKENFTDKATMDVAELRACILGLQFAKKKGYKKVEVETNSKFMITMKNNWQNEWKLNDWQKSFRKNWSISTDILESLERLCSEIDITWTYNPDRFTSLKLCLAVELAGKGCSTSMEFSLSAREGEVEKTMERNKRQRIADNPNRLPPTLLRSAKTILLNKNKLHKITCRLNIPPSLTEKILQENEHILMMASGHAYGNIITGRSSTQFDPDLAPNVTIKCSKAHDMDTLLLQEGCVVGIAWQHPFSALDEQTNQFFLDITWFNFMPIDLNTNECEDPELLFGPPVVKRKRQKICWSCHAQCGPDGRRLLWCMGCDKARYCDTECQVADWERHQNWCFEMQANEP